LRARVSTFVRADKYAGKNEHGFPEYTVRSIYLDSPTKTSLMDKEEGIKERKKLRVRGYDIQSDDSMVFLEVKRKNGNRIYKNRALIPFSKLNSVLEFGLDNNLTQQLIKKSQEEDATRFLFLMNRYRQTPVNLIVYDREAYHGIFDDSIRITFDKNIRSKLYPGSNELFTDSNLKYVRQDHFILEIKYYDPPMPLWAKSIVNEFQLQSQALSKYADGYYCHQFEKSISF
jgi:SPX domain protein involved in polyphosphate accumulation